jgi:type I restriction enzyme M protein
MANKHTRLYTALWKTCDELRGRVDPSGFKEYVLVLLFVKWISENPALARGVPRGTSFADLVRLKGDRRIGIRVNEVIRRLARATSLHGVIDVVDFSDTETLGAGQEFIERLSHLITLFEELDLRHSGEYDLLGDAYEFLIGKFAAASGMRQGQFYTPEEVGRLMTQLVGVGSARAPQTIYDPTCGSGSLLLAAHHDARNQTGTELSLFGQDIDPMAVRLARMNTFGHGCRRTELWADNIFTRPRFTTAGGGLQTFDFVLSNPPFSVKAWSRGIKPEADAYGRFALGIPPPMHGDYAFVLHILASLKPTGRAAIILPMGVLFRGKGEETIRRALVEHGYVEGVIALPANLFAGTEMPACIVVLDKAGAATRDKIIVIDASSHCVREGSKNRLRARDVRRIIDAFVGQCDVPSFARRVPLTEIDNAENACNLSVSRYLSPAEPEEASDLGAHLHGGIPEHDLDALKTYWQVFPTLRALLFAPADWPGYCRPAVDLTMLDSVVATHPDCAAFAGSLTLTFEKWTAAHRSSLATISKSTRPSRLIARLSDDLLDAFRDVPLIDPYAMYQHLLTYWAETMHDDVVWLTREGWTVVRDGVPNTDLVPRTVMARCYFADEQAAVVQLETARETCLRRQEDLQAEASRIGGAFARAKEARGQLTPATIQARLAALQEATGTEEKRARAALIECEGLIEEYARLTRGIEDTRAALDLKIAARYDEVTKDELRRLVVEEKWLPALAAGVTAERGRAVQVFTARLRALVERYATPFTAIARDVADRAARLQAHLRHLGVEWS